MRATIDKAGRVIIPAVIRAQQGLVPGPVEIVVDGSGVHIEPMTTSKLTRRGGRLVIAGAGPDLSVDDVRELRLDGQR